MASKKTAGTTKDKATAKGDKKGKQVKAKSAKTRSAEHQPSDALLASEVERLKGVEKKLREELDQSRKLAKKAAKAARKEIADLASRLDDAVKSAADSLVGAPSAEVAAAPVGTAAATKAAAKKTPAKKAPAKKTPAKKAAATKAAAPKPPVTSAAPRTAAAGSRSAPVKKTTASRAPRAPRGGSSADAPLASQTVAVLRARAKAGGVRGYSTMSKAQLISALS